jgi:hypothetical protein
MYQLRLSLNCTHPPLVTFVTLALLIPLHHHLLHALALLALMPCAKLYPLMALTLWQHCIFSACFGEIRCLIFGLFEPLLPFLQVWPMALQLHWIVGIIATDDIINQELPQWNAFSRSC